ncbi:MAG: alpha/beta fold hydrolase [Cyclobacteriaceae bacterium]|nr:alpha/beta fold hydrolase [Cyclobacteriaceae bacterium]
MPIIPSSDYKAPFYLFNGHLETIIPSAFRKIKGVHYERERLELSDGDFIDLDWLRKDSKKLMIVSHGLEGNSERHYSKGMASYFFNRGWDALAWNCRSCSGEINRLERFYHHGATEDLNEVIQHAIEKNQYDSIVLVGISMGGSLTLKYLGENGDHLPSVVKGGAAFSVPCHLGSSAKELDKPNKRFYLNRFLKKLGKKIKQKSEKFPDRVSYKGFDKIKSFEEFDTRYTSPLHGFKNAADFYERAASLPHIPHIKTPTLIVNALNDPFLPEACYPYDIAKDHPHVYLQTPERGGHTGFTLAGKDENWMEVRAFEFLGGL